MTWQANWASKREGFASAKRILEIGAGAFETSLYLARKFPDKEFVGVDFVLSPSALKNFAEIPPNLTILKHDARDFEIFATGYFDFAFSVAVVEHIRELAEHLKETHRVVKEGGRYDFWVAPFWSSSMGHHYLHWTADCPIPHYAHLYLSQDAMREHLSARLPESKVTDAMYRLYERGDLSRLNRVDVHRIARNSEFSMSAWEDEADQNYSEEGIERVFANNIYGVLREDLPFKGAKVSLLKG
jgi:SAM-dependent methyltransferase